MTPNLDDYSDDNCRSCRGTGMRLARLSAEQDYAYAQRGQPIPEVKCWICQGTGFQPPSQPPQHP